MNDSPADQDGADGDQVVIVPIEELVSDPANARLHPERNRQVVESSLKRLGPARSIVRSRGVVRAGNETLRAAIAAGVTHVKVVKGDGKTLIVVDRDDWTETEAVTYGILDNKSTVEGEWNVPVLVPTLQAIGATDAELFLTTGFEPEDVSLMLGQLKLETEQEEPGEAVTDPQKEWGGMPEFHSEDQTSYRSIIVHFETQEDVDAFAELIGHEISDKKKFMWYPWKEYVPFGEAK